MTDIIIAMAIAMPLLAFVCFVIAFGYGEWAIMYLIILTVLCYQAWRVGDK